MSGTLKLTTTVLAGTTVDNLLTGSKFDYLARPAAVTVYMVQQQVSGSLIAADFTLGNVVVGDDLVPNIQDPVITGKFGPTVNEDILAQGVGQGGDRITIRLRETVGGVGDDGIARTQIVIQDL